MNSIIVSMMPQFAQLIVLIHNHMQDGQLLAGVAFAVAVYYPDDLFQTSARMGMVNSLPVQHCSGSLLARRPFPNFSSHAGWSTPCLCGIAAAVYQPDDHFQSSAHWQIIYLHYYYARCSKLIMQCTTYSVTRILLIKQRKLQTHTNIVMMGRYILTQ